MNNTFYPHFFSLIIFTFLGISCNNQGKLNPIDQAYISLPIPQDQQTRIWKDISFREMARSKSFISSVSMNYGDNSLIYVSDYTRLNIGVYNQNAELIDSLGKGAGKGPGEFLSVFATTLDPEGNVWVNDNSNGRITILDPNNNDKWRIITPENISINAIPLDSGKYVLDEFIRSRLISFSAQNEPQIEYEPIFQDPLPWIILQQGYYAAAADNSIFKAFVFTNNLIKYNTNGEIEFFRHPIEPVAMASISEAEEPNDAGVFEKRYDFLGAEQFTSGMDISGNTIHLLISRKDPLIEEPSVPRIKEFVDVYAADSGDYLYSYNLPEAVNHFTISDNSLAATSYETGELVIWHPDETW